MFADKVHSDTVIGFAKCDCRQFGMWWTFSVDIDISQAIVTYQTQCFISVMKIGTGSCATACQTVEQFAFRSLLYMCNEYRWMVCGTDVKQYFKLRLLMKRTVDHCMTHATFSDFVIHLLFLHARQPYWWSRYCVYRRRSVRVRLFAQWLKN